MRKSNLILVSGVDGSGKTTLINNLENSERLNLVGQEPTHTPLSRQFKLRHLSTAVTHEFISQRENFYLGLQGETDEILQGHLDQGVNVATSGNTLTTYVSHTAMRGVLGVDFSPRDILNRYNEEQTLRPDFLVVLHAPIEVIEGRVRNRFANGDKSEKVWGFNSPFFFERYQEAWMSTAALLSADSDLPVYTYDTSIQTPEEILDRFISNSGLDTN